MKLFLLFLCIPIFLFGNNTKFQFRTGYFLFQDSLAREIYDHGGAEVEFEAARKIACHLDVWGNFNYFWNDGHSIGLHDPTHLDLYNLSLGLKNYYCLNSDTLFFYFGLGGALGILRINDDSPFVHKHRNAILFGGVAKTGLLHYFRRCFFFDIFADYYYQPSSFSGDRSRNIIGNSPNLGGLRCGFGLGASF